MNSTSLLPISFPYLTPDCYICDTNPQSNAYLEEDEPWAQHSDEKTANPVMGPRLSQAVAAIVHEM